MDRRYSFEGSLFVIHRILNFSTWGPAPGKDQLYVDTVPDCGSVGIREVAPAGVDAISHK